MQVLIIDTTTDYELPEVHGPFDSVYDAQVYAREYRKRSGIPGHENVQPTSDENEAWTEAGWTFAIQELPRRAVFPNAA